MAEKYYVEKVDGKIVALYAVPQEGVTETKPLSETHPDIVAFLNPPPPPKNKVYKTTIWKRCTDEEYNTIKLAMSQTSARYQAIFDNAAYISQEDALYPLVLSVATASVGEERALELLEPEF